MCFFSTPSMPAPAAVDPTPPAPPPPAPPAPPPVIGTSAASSGGGSSGVGQNPVMSNIYDPSNPESGVNAEKGAALKKARGTSQLKVDLDPVVANMAKQSGLQISK